MEKPTRNRKRSHAQIGAAAASFVAGISVSRNGALNPYMSNLSIQLTATTKKQSSEIDRQCRALWNETIVPWTPQSSFRSISNRYLPCIHGSWVARVAGSNYKHWRNQSSTWAGCAKGNPEEVAAPNMEWLLPGHHSALTVANWVGTCNGILLNPAQVSADTTKKIPYIISCNSDELINSCIQSGLKAARADDRIVVFLLEDKPRPNGHQMNILTSDPRVDKIFATNPSQVNEKLHGYPIGLKASRRWHSHLDGREATVQNRTNLLECGGITFWIAAKILGRNGELMENEGETGAGLRRGKSMKLKRNGFSCGGKIDPDEYIERLLQSKFVFSPRGFGQQNYREWEAMVAGAVPLIDTPPPTHAELYAGLPYVAVSDWSKITTPVFGG